MIWLENEKRILWQWDVNQHIFTDEDAPIIHFRYGDGVIQVPISDGTAKIPDVLLQTAGPVRLYLYDGEGTLRHAAFPVRSRPKPPGYVYTEEEMQTWDNLVGRMEKIEGSLDANIELANNASQLLTQMQESEEAAKKASEDASAAAAAAENSATPRINEVAYAAGDSGTTPPTEAGSWGAVIPSVPQGQFLWTRVTNTYISGKTEVSYSVARMGMDGSGSVSSVNEVSPDSNGNVTLSADGVGALPTSGGTMTGAIDMDGNTISGLNPPTEATQAVNKQYADLSAYPVGAIYISVSSTSPASLFGGTWEQIKDKFLLAAGNLYSAGATGGEEKHTLTADEMPTHTHKETIYAGTGSFSGALLDWSNSVGGSQYGTTYAGGSMAHNNMPPYIAVYMWKRIA